MLTNQIQVNWDRVLAKACIHSLPLFIREFWSVVEPNTPLSWNWHHDEICKVLQRVTNGELKRVIFNIPPGSGKSLIINVLWPAWEWASRPHYGYLTAAYSDKNTIRDNLRVRSIVTSNKYRRLFWDDYKTQDNPQVRDVRLSSDQYAKVRFDTTERGYRIATSVAGAGLGEHPDRIIIDDPHKAQETASKARLEAVIEWHKTTISTRRAKSPAEILVMQRLHDEDLCGYLLAQSDTWYHVLYPMRYEVRTDSDSATGARTGVWECRCHRQPDTTDPRSKHGELLWPAVYGEEKVKQIELDLGPYESEGQLQQRPTKLEGEFFKREWFNIVDVAPGDLEVVGRGWDNAASKDGDYTAGVKMARKDDKFYILDVESARVDDADPVIQSTAQLDGQACRIREEQDPGASGKKVITYHIRLLAGYDYASVPISGDKMTRARPFRAQCQAGNVYLVRGKDDSWIPGYVKELCAFPLGKHDDKVDASSCIFNDIALEPKKKKRRLVYK